MRASGSTLGPTSQADGRPPPESQGTPASRALAEVYGAFQGAQLRLDREEGVVEGARPGAAPGRSWVPA